MNEVFKNEQKKQAQIFRRIFIISALCLPLKAGDALEQIQVLIDAPSAVRPEGVVTVEKGATLDLSQYGVDDKFYLGGTINVSGTLKRWRNGGYRVFHRFSCGDRRDHVWNDKCWWYFGP